MNRLLLVLPILALAGCELRDATTPKKRVASQSLSHVKPSTTPTVSALSSSNSQQRIDSANTTGDPYSRVRSPETEEPKEEPPEKAPPIPDSFKVLNKDKKTIFFEVAKDGTRRVHLLAEVCLREGPLEVFLCKWNTKEHESILHVDADGREIHTALVLANAKPGHPVKYAPKFEAPTGTKIKVSLTYRQKGKVKTCSAGEWVKDKKTGKDLHYDWVFAGSKLLKDPDRPEAIPYYTANQGEFICLSNFPDAMLDLPVKSSKEAAELIFDANTPRIPPLRTPVIVTLEPIGEKKK